MSKGIRVVRLAFRIQWNVCLMVPFELVFLWHGSSWRMKSLE